MSLLDRPNYVLIVELLETKLVHMAHLSYGRIMLLGSLKYLPYVWECLQGFQIGIIIYDMVMSQFMALDMIGQL